MGEIEKRVRTRRRRENIQRAILGTIASVGILSMALVAPNALQSLKLLGISETKQNKRIKRSLNRLVVKGLVEFHSKGSKKFLAITEKGRKVIRLVELRNFKLPKPKRWDGKWRMIIFDIKEKRRRSRDLLRETLISLGFKKLQNSVWVYPYDCEDFMLLLKADFELGKSLLYIVADEIENDRELRKFFNLP